MDLKAFFNLNYGLYIVSTQDGGQDVGCIVNTVTQVTNTPNQLMVAINKENYTCGAVRRAGVFAVTVLTEDVSSEIIGRFGFKSSAEINKFDGIDYALDANGSPYPMEGVNAHFACQVRQELDVGTHMLFVGEVVDCSILSAAPSMTYAFYHKVKKGLTPPKASSYQAAAPEAPAAAPASGAKQWRCSVCGYIYEGDTLPDDYKCPVCGQPASVFVPVESAAAPASGAKQWRCSVCGYIYEGDTLPDDYKCPVCGQPASVFVPV